MQTTKIDAVARAYLFLFGNADGVYVRVAGAQVGPVVKIASDGATALAVAAAVNKSEDMAKLVSAVADGPSVILTARAGGVEGNALDLDAEATVGGAVMHTPFYGGVSVTLAV